MNVLLPLVLLRRAPDPGRLCRYCGAQTGMYPSDSPGGWQIIGRTPVRLYDGNSEKPTLLEAGDYVRYVPVSEEEFLDIKAHLATYEVKSFYCKESELHGR